VDKKSLPLIIVLVVLIVFYFQIMEFFGLYKPPAPVPAQSQTTQADSTVGLSQTGGTATESPTVPTTTGADSVKAVAVDSSLEVDSLVVVTKNYTVTMSTFGGGPVGLSLNNYRYRNGMPIEMLVNAPSATPELTFAGGTFSGSKVHYISNTAPGKYEASTSPVTIAYSYRGADGGEIVKRYTFHPDHYDYDLVVDVRDPHKLGFERQYGLWWNTPLTGTEPQKEVDQLEMQAVGYMSGARVHLDEYNDDGKLNQTISGATSWAAVREKYFAAAVIPLSREAEGLTARGYTEDVSDSGGVFLKAHYLTAGLDLPFATGQSFVDSFAIFVGPMDYTLMATYNKGLEDLLDIGTTPYVGWVIKPFAIAIIWLLPKLYSIIPNYGFVIIIFALIVKLLTLPLSLKSFKSMAAMRDIQPKVEELKKRHKNDMQKMNAETMALYKKHGVNPFSGCLPVLMQMPLFFAMFSVFKSTILLREAPFFWFIDDLSRGAQDFTDPYMILVVLMVAAQFISQKMTTGTQANPQAKIFLYIMPLFMGFIFRTFAAGLVLYWTTFSILSLLDYFIYKRGQQPAEQGGIVEVK
jgi:YidC/Oxa1 family membrane protein insertase